MSSHIAIRCSRMPIRSSFWPWIAAFFALLGPAAIEASAAPPPSSSAQQSSARSPLNVGSAVYRHEIGAKTPATVTRYYPYGYGLYRPWLYRPSYYPFGGYGYAYRPYYGGYGYPYGGYAGYYGGYGGGYYGGGYGYYGGGWPYYSAYSGGWPYYTSAYGGWPYYSTAGYYGGWPNYSYGAGYPYAAGYGGFGYAGCYYW